MCQVSSDYLIFSKVVVIRNDRTLIFQKSKKSDLFMK